MGVQPWSTAWGHSGWWQGSRPWIWHSPMADDAVDHGVGCCETRRDPVVAGLAQYASRDRRPLAVDPADARNAKQLPAASVDPV
jgi:hypothetical protein